MRKITVFFNSKATGEGKLNLTIPDVYDKKVYQRLLTMSLEQKVTSTLSEQFKKSKVNRLTMTKIKKEIYKMLKEIWTNYIVIMAGNFVANILCLLLGIPVNISLTFGVVFFGLLITIMNHLTISRFLRTNETTN